MPQLPNRRIDPKAQVEHFKKTMRFLGRYSGLRTAVLQAGHMQQVIDSIERGEFPVMDDVLVSILGYTPTRFFRGHPDTYPIADQFKAGKIGYHLQATQEDQQ